MADNKLGEITNTKGDRIRIQKQLDRLKQWVESKKMTFNKDKCDILCLGQKAYGSKE